MNTLIIGSGGREHTIAHKIAQSKLANNLFIAPGNAGTSKLGTNLPINITDFKILKQAILKHKIDFVFVGPEAPLVNGIHNFILNDKDLKHINVFGPQQKAAQLEGSKEFSKEFLYRHNIPTAKYQSFTTKSLEKGYLFLETLKPPYVLKADGLAAGKGVLILNNLQEAKTELKEMLTNQKFGKASNKVVIEEFLNGIELSCFVVTDGKSYKVLPYAKDYKRINEGDKGLNTGGMGAVSPVPFADAVFLNKVEKRIIKPTINGLQKDNLPYKGVLFIGLIKVNNEPFVIEYNVRFGDPETEVIIPRIKSDLLELFNAVAEEKLDQYHLEIDDRTVTTVMLVSGGYPELYEKNKEIFGLENVTESIVFHAGTRLKNNKVFTNGGRVLAITSYGKNSKEAMKKAYKSIKNISFDQMNYRTDIGFDL
ncbi:MAG: phosphoribosylamine--glycine ligase [Flavobacteriaceae bacterium]|nr:phosphoribosylamine--glycine ligase [Flavobacteriaceae bacterium]